MDLWKPDDFLNFLWSDIYQQSAWIGVIYAFIVHLKNNFMCIVRSFHEFHDNVVIRATYAHILPNEKYRVIIIFISSD